MSLLWAVPALAAVAGGIVLLVGLRSLQTASEELGDELGALEELRAAVRRVQDEAGVGAGTLDRIRSARSAGYDPRRGPG
jgi:hypothetical protein